MPVVRPAPGPITASNALGVSSRAGSYVSLLELQTYAGDRYYFGSANLMATSRLSEFDSGLDVADPQIVTFVPRLLEAPAFTFTGTLETITSRTQIDNLGGNTVERDGSKMLSRGILSGALFVFRLYDPALEVDDLTVFGNVTDVEVEDDLLELSLRGRMNFSSVKAGATTIGPSCSLTFGSMECGSTSATPCQNTYGSCTQRNRFKGWVEVYNTSMSQVNPVNIAQPVQTVESNKRRAN